MSFYADLHIHSRFSRATSRDCNLENLAYWARKKGLSVLGTGDFTHPEWVAEIRQNLAPAEPGLFRLRDELDRAVQARLDASCRGPVRFVLEVEISTIYKSRDKTRKVHHVIFVPDLESADRVTARLAQIGNLKSDGRPILGLDSRDLLEIVLESGAGSYLVPAHIWTPWFSALGSKSGFDSIDECYRDLAPHIFAVETGLSSDPPMNWRVSQLDRFRLISNSDAHSPRKLGREACVFETEPDYYAMRRALETGQGYGGTVEFFPEEGKYHMDGHRKCGVCLAPEETRAQDGRCPVCGKLLTIGVMYRVEALADRAEGQTKPAALPYRSFIPLPEVLGEIEHVGSGSKRVARAYDALIAQLGPELHILEHADLEELRRAGGSPLAEAIGRMRARRVIRKPGFDGEYGVIRLFTEEELQAVEQHEKLLDVPAAEPPRPDLAKPASAEPDVTELLALASEAETMPALVREPPQTYMALGTGGVLDGLDPEQRAAAESTDGALLVVAGPGSGKTRTLTFRIAHLIGDLGIAPEECLAITFTNRAANEMHERLHVLLPNVVERIAVLTFHGLGLAILRKYAARLGLAPSARVLGERERRALAAELWDVSERKAAATLARLGKLRAGGANVPEHDALADAQSRYVQALRARNLLDFDDLIALPIELLESCPDVAEACRVRYGRLSVDEYQDIDARQYRLLRLLVTPAAHLCAIGDPDQAIYGFRGADVRFFQQFTRDFPGARVVRLKHNYRSTRTIVDAALQVIAPRSLLGERDITTRKQHTARIVIREAPSDRAEAEFVVHTVERMIGGSTFFSMDSGRVGAADGADLSFGDFGVLFRTDAQADLLAEAFARSGIPFERRSHTCLLDDPVVAALVRKIDEGPHTLPLTERLAQAVADIEEPAAAVEARRASGLLQTVAARNGTDAVRFASELAMGMSVDLWDPRADRVSLLTLHAAKGLEFRVVFMTGCEDGVLPLRFGPEEAPEDQTNEERRLFFVGMTRAQDALFLCHAKKRMWRGKSRDMPVSPFLTDIQDQLLQRADETHRRKARRPAGEQLELF